ncbi:zinc finger protein [Culex quinquefasciatus]|uniref:Zinc finger protein n=1 Tax=Culex quinquefasciatus TaxID=7176 RepID=B0XK94_CULQU|nr:zinc finger protein [Culex quinquefasciatus]|eukprot:XP_001870066.1 zinc finger protein [Culex quinquefasciatus]
MGVLRRLPLSCNTNTMMSNAYLNPDKLRRDSSNSTTGKFAAVQFNVCGNGWRPASKFHPNQSCLTRSKRPAGGSLADRQTALAIRQRLIWRTTGDLLADKICNNLAHDQFFYRDVGPPATRPGVAQVCLEMFHPPFIRPTYAVFVWFNRPYRMVRQRVALDTPPIESSSA